MSGTASNIVVVASFPESTFFSGEEFFCTLTFKNVASQHQTSPSSSTTSLTQFEQATDSSGPIQARQLGAEWMAESGRSASEGVLRSVDAPRLSKSSPMLSRGTGWENPSGPTSSDPGHGRSQSVVSRKITNQNPADTKQLGNSPFNCRSDV